MESSFSNLLIALVGVVMASAIAWGAFIVNRKHKRLRRSAQWLMVALAASIVYPIVWEYKTHDPFWERFIGVALWGALIGGSLCGIHLWVDEEASTDTDASEGE